MNENMNCLREAREIYLDNAATTKPMSYIADAVRDAMFDSFGNPSSLHDAGRKAKKIVEDAREIIANYLGANPSEIYFTAGGSESDNLAIRGVAPYLKEIGKTIIVTSEIEHHAVLNTCEELKKDGFKIIYMPVDQDGRVDIEEFDMIMKKYDGKIGLVSIMAVNNEIGSIQLIDDIGDLCEEHDVLFMTDAVQAYGHIPLNVNESKVDLLSASGHKIHAMKGIGILYVRDGTPIRHMISGGGQEHGMRAGTENVYGILSMGFATTALKDAQGDSMNYFADLRKLFLSELDRLHVEYRVNCDNGVPNIISLTLPHCESEAMLLLLNQKKVYVSAGSACTAGSLEPSHVLKSFGLSDEDASCTIRISLGWHNHEADMVDAAKAISECTVQLRAMMEG